MGNGVANELMNAVEAAAPKLAALKDKVVSRKPAPERWSVKEILGHLVDSAANNHQRFIRAQEVDVLVFPKYEQDSWVSKQDYNNSSWPELVELWRLYNRHLAQVISRIPEEKLAVECRIGPNEAVTLQYLIEDYLAHLKHHLDQINDLSGSAYD